MRVATNAAVGVAGRRRVQPALLARSHAGEAFHQPQGCVDALGEELIGQLAVGQRSGELQRSDQQSEDHERFSSRRVGSSWVHPRRHVVRDAEQRVSESLPRCIRASPDLVEQRGGWAAVRALIAVLGDR